MLLAKHAPSVSLEISKTQPDTAPSNLLSPAPRRAGRPDRVSRGPCQPRDSEPYFLFSDCFRYGK